MNALANVSVTFPALILSPLTLLFGPIAAFNVAGTLSPVVSGYCMFLLASKLVSFPPAQVLAGVLWGFSPYVVSSLPYGHLVDVLGFFLPLAGLVCYDLIIEHKHRPSVDGILLGVLVIAQFFTSTEVLVLVGFATPLGIVLAVILRPEVIRGNRYRLSRAVRWAAATVVIGLTYPVWFALEGPRHIVGAVWPSAFTASVSGIVNPGASAHTLIPPNAHWAGYWGAIGPQAGFLGWGVVGFVAVSFPVWRKSVLGRACALTAAWAMVLSWGVPTGSTSWWPWRVFYRLPIASSVETFRFADIVAFCAALLIALALNGWWQCAVVSQRGWSRTDAVGIERPLKSRIRMSLGVGATATAFASLIPAFAAYTLPIVEHVTPTPPWFAHEAAHLPLGTRVLTIPFTVLNWRGPFFPPQVTGSDFMVYQANTFLRYDLLGGYVVVPSAMGVSAWRRPLKGTSAILEGLSTSQHPPSISAPGTSEVRHTLRNWGVQVAVVTQSRQRKYAVRYLTDVYGRPPIEQRGAAVWYGPPTLR